MTDEMMTLRTLLEKSSDADLLREMIGFTAQRLMELETESLTGGPIPPHMSASESCGRLAPAGDSIGHILGSSYGTFGCAFDPEQRTPARMRANNSRAEDVSSTMSDFWTRLCWIVPAMLVLPAVLVGCASAPAPSGSDMMLNARNELQAVLTQPFNDFNLVRTEIPEKLTQVRDAPYATPMPGGCDDLTAAVEELDKMLGPDLEGGSGAAGKPLISKEAAERAARDAARDAASSWIPFRGAVRYVTGAERHARALKEATLAGIVRRAYLKGLREALQCAVPLQSAATSNVPEMLR
jgi:hypothetical protein